MFVPSPDSMEFRAWRIQRARERQYAAKHPVLSKVKGAAAPAFVIFMVLGAITVASEGSREIDRMQQRNLADIQTRYDACARDRECSEWLSTQELEEHSPAAERACSEDEECCAFRAWFLANMTPASESTSSP